MASNYWIIESEHRGCYCGGDFDGPWVNHQPQWRPRFRWSILRTDPAVIRFMTKEAAEKELHKVTTFAPKAKAYVHEIPAKVAAYAARRAAVR